MSELTVRYLPGDRRSGEPDKAFQAARLYLEIGPDRSQKAVATRLGKQPSQIQKWATKWAWMERARDHDNHLASEAQRIEMNAFRENAELWSRRKEETRERSFQLSQKLTTKAEQMLAFPLVTTTIKDGGTIVQPAKWNLRDASNLLSTAAKLSEQAFKQDDKEKFLRS